MSGKKDRRIQILVAIVVAAATIIASFIQVSEKQGEKAVDFDAKNINNSSVIIGNNSNIKNDK